MMKRTRIILTALLTLNIRFSTSETCCPNLYLSSLDVFAAEHREYLGEYIQSGGGDESRPAYLHSNSPFAVLDFNAGLNAWVLSAQTGQIGFVHDQAWCPDQIQNLWFVDNLGLPDSTVRLICLEGPPTSSILPSSPFVTSTATTSESSLPSTSFESASAFTSTSVTSNGIVTTESRPPSTSASTTQGSTPSSCCETQRLTSEAGFSQYYGTSIGEYQLLKEDSTGRPQYRQTGDHTFNNTYVIFISNEWTIENSDGLQAKVADTAICPDNIASVWKFDPDINNQTNSFVEDDTILFECIDV